MFKKIGSLFLFILALQLNSFASPKPNKDFTIVIEATHDGFYKGMGVAENPKASQLVNDYIQTLKQIATAKNFNIIVANESNQLFDLNKRKEFLKLNKANLFISLHFNHSEDAAKRGFECYVPTDNNTFENRVLGKFVGAELYSVQGMKFNGVNIQKKEVLNGLPVASAIIELGYLSNAEDSQIIESTEGKNEICEKLLNAILSFKTQLEMGK